MNRCFQSRLSSTSRKLPSSQPSSQLSPPSTLNCSNKTNHSKPIETLEESIDDGLNCCSIDINTIPLICGTLDHRASNHSTRRSDPKIRSKSFPSIMITTTARSSMLMMLLMIIVILYQIPKCLSFRPYNYYAPHQYPETGPLSYNFPLIKAFRGELTPNNMLSQATQLCEGALIGPSSLVVYQHYLYTGTIGGGIYRCNLETGNATRIVKVANELCRTKYWDASLCGRPLGIRVDRSGNLYFIDAYLGLHQISFYGNSQQRLRVKRLLSPDQIGSRFMTHLALDEGGGANGGIVFYITIASTRHDLNEWPRMILEPDRSGRVIRFDIDLNQTEVLMQGLWYPSSVQLSDDRTSILVVEFTARRVVRHYIRGPQRGKTETWIQNLPGEGEHLIRSLDKYQETYWLPVVNARNVSSPSMIDWLSDKPWIRDEIMQNFTALGQKIETLGSKWSNSNLERLGFRLKNLHFFYDEALANDYGMVLELDANGRLLGSLHSIDGTNHRLSEVVEGPTENPYERVLYIGSYVNPFILKLTIPNFTQDYQQKNKQHSSTSSTSSSKMNENGVDFSLLPYGTTRRAITATIDGNQIDDVDLYPNANKPFILTTNSNGHQPPNGLGSNLRRLRSTAKESSRYSSST
ncbi:6-phosphofructokinase [Sarcoptes scabiei]|nr:6-phosphofructokinase [Sarcoptes scabiei]